MPKPIIDAERCKGCGLCVSACPKKILTLSAAEMNKRGYRPAELTDSGACIACAFCASMCPDTAIVIRKD